MITHLLLATSEGLIICDQDGDSWRKGRLSLSDRDVASVIAREGVILAGTTEGVYRSDDLGLTWSAASVGLTHPHIRWLAYHPDVSDLEFAGTEPAGIFVSHTGGERWQACPEITTLRESGEWYLPYSPEAGCVRGFSFHGQRAYAAVEVGGVLISDDQGETWRLVAGSTGKGSLTAPSSPLIASDVHSIEVHPSSPELVVAPTNSGLYRSEDGGQTWHNLYECYCRAVWIDPKDSSHLIFGPAQNVDSNGRIEETLDGGRTWQRLAPAEKSPWRRHMVERFAQAGGQLLAVLSNGELWAQQLGTSTWEHILSDVENINACTVMVSA